MKNVIRTIKKSILLATVLTAMLSNATEISSTINKGDLKRTALTINNVKEGDLISIRDYSGVILYKELINFTGTYRKGFDLTSLPNGSYFFEVEKDMEVKTIPFSVDQRKVTFNKEKEVTTFKPFVRQKNDLVLISKLAPNLAPLNITVYSEIDGAFELIYSEKIEGVLTIERVYKLKKGKHKLVFNTDNKEFTKFINN